VTRRGAAAAVLGLALPVFLLGCAGAPRPAPEGVSPLTPPADRQVMVTFRPAPPPLLARATAELERAYGLRTVYAWTMASLGEQCVVFEVPPGREPRELVRRLSSDPRVGIAQTVETFTTLAGAPAGAYNDPYAHLQHSVRALRLDRAHAQVINFSLAGPEDPLLGRLVAAALGRGIVVVAADGGRAARGYPARLDGVIGTLGTDLEGGLRLPAAAKPTSSLAAPAVDVLTTVPRGAYDFVSGSSLAAAQIAGVAALLLEKRPGLDPAQVAEHIRETARPVAGTGNPRVVGQVDACAALARLLGGDCR
jgi:hypothetical protein